MPELSEEVDASAQIAGNVLIVNFTKPIRIAIESIAMQAPGYFSAARRDPDSKAIRFALARKVKLNSIAAAEKFFIDLVPDTWSGAPPALPQEVIEELARRARAAERLERLARLAAQPKKLPPVRVRVAHQPTFMRYVFDVPEHTSVAADRADDRLTLTFDAPITFDKPTPLRRCLQRLRRSIPRCKITRRSFASVSRPNSTFAPSAMTTATSSISWPPTPSRQKKAQAKVPRPSLRSTPDKPTNRRPTRAC